MIQTGAVPAMSSCPTPTVLDHLTRATTAGVVTDLRRYLSAVTDPRHRRGVRHSLTLILTLAAAAVAAGARSFTAIGNGPPTPRNTC
jgi:DDE family transposase